MTTAIDADADVGSGAVDKAIDWDEYAARIAQSSQQHIARLIRTIKTQQAEITELRARLQSTPSCVTAAAIPAATSTAATSTQQPADSPGTSERGQQSVTSDRITVADGSDGCDGTSSNKRGRQEMEDAASCEQQWHGRKRCFQRTNSGERVDDVHNAAAVEADLDSTQPLPTFVVNILPPSPVKPTNITVAVPPAQQPPHNNMDTQPVDHTQPALPQEQPQQHDLQQRSGGLTAADCLFDELTEQEVADADTRRKRLQAQSLATDAFTAMKQQQYSTTIQLLTQSLALLPPSAYPPSFLRARLTCYAKLGRRREAATDAEAMWQVWPGSLSAFMRGTVECRGKRYQQAVAWLREAEWRKRDEDKTELERVVERQASSGGVEVDEAEDVWAVTPEEREMRVVPLQAIRDSLSKVEQRIASDTAAQSTTAAVKQQAEPLAVLEGVGGPKAGDVSGQSLRVIVVEEKGKGGKRVTFVAPPTSSLSAVPAVT